ncbi:hypothetical protein L211DRAFT_854439 [Terfezia boudieri ATCC MYA-4762]|uniref:Uncharacterized protein n=1 Tax=Terfezia boudieri ATCC MYA-4762 TaxID=1051890 RepID=A0A3N4L5J0_9PEZI|nr:hypothetical protein L211DRAFT_854439 [Terfezia boudieri ATCC MYA-4762]
MPPKRKQPDANEDSEDDNHVIRSNHAHAKLVGFFEEDIPENLYGLWRLRFSTPIGQINYLTDKSISQAVNILAQDIAKKVRSGAVVRDKAVKAAREAHAAKYLDDPSPPTFRQLLPPLLIAPMDTNTMILDTSSGNPQPKRIRTQETIKGLQRKGVKGKQEDDQDKDEDEDEEVDAEELRQTLRGPKRIVGASKGMGYAKPVLKGDKGIVGVGTKWIVRPQGIRTSKKVVNVGEDNEEEEEEEEEAPKNIKTRSGTGSVGPQGTQTSKKVVIIEEDDEEEEEEAPKTIKTRSGTGRIQGGKGTVKPHGTRTSKKVIIIEEDNEQEEEVPTYSKIRSRKVNVGAGKGIVRPQGTRTSKKVVDNKEEEEAPTYTKTKSGMGSIEAGKGIVRPQGTRMSKKVMTIEEVEEDDEEEEEVPKNIKNKSGKVNVGGATRISKKIVAFEEDDEEEEEEAPAYIKTKSRKGYVGGAKGIVGGQGSGRLKGMVKISAVKITRVQREEEDEDEEEAADEEGQEEEEVEKKEVEEDEVEEEESSIVMDFDVFDKGGLDFYGFDREGLDYCWYETDGECWDLRLLAEQELTMVVTRKSLTKPEAKGKGKEMTRKRGASCDLRDDTTKRQSVNTKKSSSRPLKSNGKGQASTSSPGLPSSNESSGSAGGQHRGMESQCNISSTIKQTEKSRQGSSQLSYEWGSSEINQARSSLPPSIKLSVHDNNNRLNIPKKRLTGAKANTRRNRSFTQFDGITKAVVYNAANRIERITLFEEPLPDTDHTEYILAPVWKEAKIECRVDEERTSKIDAYLRSMQSHTRSHLVYEAKRHIVKLYEFDQTCSSEYIHKRSGVFQDGDYFNYTNSSEQWEGLPTMLEQSLLKVIQLGILGHCQVHGKVLRWEQAESYSIDNDELDEYAKELVEDLKRAEETHLIPCGYFEEGSPMLPDTEGEVDDMPTMYDKNTVYSPESERYDSSREDFEDAEKDSGDTVDTGSEAVEDEEEDGEDNSEDSDSEDADLEDEEDSDGQSEDGDSEDEL